MGRGGTGRWGSAYRLGPVAEPASVGLIQSLNLPGSRFKNSGVCSSCWALSLFGLKMRTVHLNVFPVCVIPLVLMALLVKSGSSPSLFFGVFFFFIKNIRFQHYFWYYILPCPKSLI